MRVCVANRSPVASAIVDQSFGLDDLAAFMGSVDAVVVCLPLASNTAGIVDRAALGAMRPDAVLINVGRGPVIDEHALFDALSNRRIGGAIIDTWYQYPTADRAECAPSTLDFAGLDNVTLTPHMSGWTTGTVARRKQAIADNIGRLVRGEPLVNVLKVAGI
jgi:phosphoglycerate dehydrogenase-like enzyme